MEYKKIFLFMVFLLAVFSLSKIRLLDDVLMPGNQVEMFTSVVNSYNTTAEDVRVVAYFPDLGEIYQKSRFSVEDNYNKGQFMWWNMPSTVPAGDYLVRIAVSNDNHNVHKFRYITVE